MKHWCAALLILFCLSAKAQQLKTVNFKKIEASLKPEFATKTISGNLDVHFQILKATDSVYLDAKNIMDFKVTSNGKEVKSRFDGNHLILYESFQISSEHSASITYTAKPTQALYFVNNDGESQIWSQGQGKYTSHWLPSIDDMNDKIEFDLSVTAPSDKMVVLNGKLAEKEIQGENILWQFDMEHPMSSYLVALTVGDYQVKELTSDSGVPIQLYYYPEDKAEVEPTYRYTKRIFDFFEKEIGFPFPWQNYKEVPVKDFLYAGMENTSLTIFSDAFVVDSTGFEDRNFVNVNAHELAHQWFGDLVTETSSTHHWLQEGFATYYALLAEREVFGEDYYYWKLYENAEELKELSDQGKGETLLNPKASSLTFYQKGAWALHILREKIGDEAFRKAVRDYLKKNKFQNVETSDFLAALPHRQAGAEAASGQDLTDWEKDWLQQSAFQADAALESLKKSSFIKKYLELSALRKISLDQKKDALAKILLDPSDYMGQEAVHQLADTPFGESQALYKLALSSGNALIRQAVAISLQEVPITFKTEYETLLDDPSYVTREAALFALWVSFPESRVEYLKKLEGVPGFSDKNIETLWLALSLATPDFKPEGKKERYETLVNYTDPKFSFQIRENAFRYLYQLQLYENESLSNLVLGCVHFNWRFAQSCRSILDMLMKDAMWLNALRDLQLPDQKAQDFLTKKLAE